MCLTKVCFEALGALPGRESQTPRGPPGHHHAPGRPKARISSGLYFFPETPTLKLKDANELPRYSLVEAAHYLRMSRSTVKNWVVVRRYVRRPETGDPRLSYSNLLELHVLKGLRRHFGVKMTEVRQGLEYARTKLGTERVLLSRELRANFGNVFVERRNRLINIGKGGQEAMPAILDRYLSRIQWDKAGHPIDFYPWTRANEETSPRVVAIRPTVAYGRPVVASRGITTAIIAERFSEGESIAALAADYDLTPSEVEEAVRYEQGAVAA